MTSNVKLFHGDCLTVMKNFPDKSVDMVLCDLPYGTTRNKWDSPIPLDQLWEAYERIIKDNGAIVLFGQTPFDKVLGASNLNLLKYEWIWDKKLGTGHLNAKKMPLKRHENILVFYKALPTYNPQFRKGQPFNKGFVHGNSSNYGKQVLVPNKNETGERYPNSILEFSNANRNNRLHPTQKPVEILEYLIKTYTQEGEVILDNAMGSGSTGIAAINTGRNFIGIELDNQYFQTAQGRIVEGLRKVTTTVSVSPNNPTPNDPPSEVSPIDHPFSSKEYHPVSSPYSGEELPQDPLHQILNLNPIPDPAASEYLPENDI